MSQQAAFGTRLRYSVSGVIYNIHSVADISGPSVARETIDVTTHDSPDGYREYLPGVGDGGEVTFDLVFDSSATGHDAIEQLAANGTPLQFQLLVPRADDQLLNQPSFNSAGTWSVAGGWAISGGYASITAASPAGALLSQNVTGLDSSEIYTVAVDVAVPGTGVVEVGFDGEVLGILSLAAIGVQRFEFRPAGTEGDVTIQAQTGPASVQLASVSLYGIARVDEERFDFAGIFTQIGHTFPVADALRASATVKVTGKPVFNGLP